MMSSLKPSFLQAALPARQHGVVLFIALIVMVALSLARVSPGIDPAGQHGG